MKALATIAQTNSEVTTGTMMPTLQTMIEFYLNTLDVQKVTRRNYSVALQAFSDYVNSGERIFTEYTQAEIKQYKNYLIQNFKSSTANLYFVVLKQFFAYLHNYDVIKTNITMGVKAPKNNKLHKHEPLATDDAVKLLQYDTTPRNKAIIALMLVCGLREVEIVRANVEDYNGTTLHVMGKGRTDKSDFVVIPQQVRSIIDGYLATRRTLPPTAPLFESRQKTDGEKRLKTNMIGKIVRKALQELNLKNNTITPHSLRHTAGSVAIENEVPIYDVATMLRHTSTAPTEIYVAGAKARKRLVSGAEYQVASILFNYKLNPFKTL